MSPLVAGPWLIRNTRELTDERRERIRSQERAELAAHVHDSVVQTLTLIQRNADDPRTVVQLARAEERALRQWLYRPGGADPGMFRAALEAAAAEVEEAHGGAVEVVSVGDATVDEHPGCADPGGQGGHGQRGEVRVGGGPVSVYAELEPAPGLDLRPRPGPGLRPRERSRPTGSVCGSRSSAGWSGTAASAVITSEPGEGAEVRLTMPRTYRARGGAMTDAPRVVLVDDHRMFRTGVRAELGDSVDVVGEAADVDSAVNVIAATRPDVVLLDVHLPGGNGQEVVRRCAAAGVETQFLALSVSDAAEDVIAVIRAGARGYVTKSITGPELTDAVRRVAGGDAVFSPRLAGFVLDAFAGSPDVPGRRRGAGPAVAAGARGAAADRARLRVQGGRAASCSSRSRPSRRTCRPCCASCSCRTGTSSRSGPPTGASSDLSPPCLSRSPGPG